MTSVGDPLVGHVLDGRYRILGRLARGGMATVYSAEDLRLRRTVAIKVMHVGLGDDEEFSRKFDREARAAARLSHPHVVAVFDQGTDNGRPYIVMEYVAGHTLRDVITREAPIAPLRALEMIEPVLSALAAAHEAGLVHRDIKPENVLISERGHIKVADFGLAKAISAQTSTATAGLLIGTVSYLPPELVTSGRADARSDVYSTGIVLFEMLTGRKPHVGDSPIQVAWAHVNTDVPAPSSVTGAYAIPPYVDALIKAATARPADARPYDARVLLDQVRRVQSALRNGAADDRQLTQDLTVALASLTGAPRSTAAAPGPPAPRRPVDPRAGEPTTEVAGAASTTVARVRPSEQPHFLSRYATSTDPVPSLPAAQPAPQAAAAQPAAASWPPPLGRDTGVREDPRGRPAAHRMAEHELRRRRRRFRGAIAVIIVLMLTAVTALASWYVTRGRFTTAPSLTNLTQGQAVVTARRSDLDVTFDPIYSETVRSGRVVSTDPGAGSRITKGGVLHVLLSQGPERHPVPALAGLTQDAAVQALTSAGLHAGKVRTAYSDTVAKGTVLASGQPAGAKLKPDATVALTVSAGPRPIPLPDYTGKSAVAAVKALTAAGFRVTSTTANSDTVASGLVIAQLPGTGTGVKGDAVAITRSLGPVLVTVPRVRAMGIRAAAAVVRRAGFAVRTRPVLTNFLGVGYVAYTDPSSGSKAPRGSTITLYYV